MLSVDTEVGYRSGKSFNVNEAINMVDDYEWDYAYSFIIYYWEDNGKEGGDDDMFNDCLFTAIASTITRFNLPNHSKTPENFKEQLGIGRFDKISIDLMPKVEDLLRVNINITGDYTFTSANKHTNRMNVNLELLNGHYAIDKSNYKVKNQLLGGVSFRPRSLIVYQLQEESVYCYDGNTELYLEYDDFYYKKNQSYKGEESYVFKDVKDMTLEEFYDYLMNETNTLKDLTKGAIDLSNSGYNFKTEAIKIANKCLRIYDTPEEITRLEQEWLCNSLLGGIIFSNPCRIENAYDYDVRSAYPAAMSDRNFTFPIKQGEFKQITEFPEKFVSYGIYRCVIERSGDENVDKLFRFNRLNFYTHYDITTAKHLHLIVNLIVDDEANALLYSKDRLNGNKVFLGIFQTLYNIRDRSVFAKKILNTVWGQLCAKKKIRRTNYKPVNLESNDEVIELKPVGKRLHITYVKKDDYFKYDYARLGTFLTARVRNKIAMTLYPYRDSIIKAHTDGFISKMEIPGLNIGDQLGQWKVKVGSFEVFHSSRKVVEIEKW